MGKATRTRPAPQQQVTGYDATPERLAKEDSAIVPTMRDPGESRLKKARQFRKPHLDRWHKAGILDQRQYDAGDYYREMHERQSLRLRVVASYGERTGAPVHPGDFGYGLPTLNAQAEARSKMHLMRQELSRYQHGLVEAFLIRDHMPRYGGRKHGSMIAEIRTALDALANYLRLGA